MLLTSPPTFTTNSPRFSTFTLRCSKVAFHFQHRLFNHSTSALNELVPNFGLAHSYHDDYHLSNQPAEIAFSMVEQSINIPQVLVFAVVAFLVYRWYSSKPSANGTRPVASRSVRINPAQIDTIAQMFPQLNRRDIAWDLQRNGGNAAATTERVLSGRSLDSVCCCGSYLRGIDMLTFCRLPHLSNCLKFQHQQHQQDRPQPSQSRRIPI